MILEYSDRSVEAEIGEQRIIIDGRSFEATVRPNPWSMLEGPWKIAPLSDEDKKRNAHVFLSAWKIWLEMRENGEDFTADAATAKLFCLNMIGRVTDKSLRVHGGFGYTTDFAGYGYFCYPPVLGTSNPPTLGGFCHIRCDSGASATASSVNVPLLDGDPGAFTNAFAGEARCGGLNMLGYKCLPTTAGYPERERVCMRVCNVRNTVKQSAALCDYQLNQTPDAKGNPSTSFSFSNGQPARFAVVGQSCTAVAGVTVNTCNWTPDFEPRDPVEWTGP